MLAFAHGYAMDHRMWDQQVAHLRDRYRCITVDARGHGQTGGTAPFTQWDVADDLIALLHGLGISRAVLVGMSQGGFVVSRAAVRAPELVAGLVIVSSTARAYSDEQRAEVNQLIDAWSAGMDDALADVLESVIIGAPSQANEVWKERWKRWDAAQLRNAFVAVADREDFTDRLPEITAPTLIIHGDQDNAFNLDEEARPHADGLPHGRLTVIDGAGHGVNMTHPARVNVELDAFLAEPAVVDRLNESART
ncbi:alpha/beta fold hydrolase [Nocardia xishanensis]|uniref:Alpha/beta fold hydrolase n=1 Tax=Nocardia xishanensis TaxID=238964 RepID=A0ABW7XBT6_9NOCA